MSAKIFLKVKDFESAIQKCSSIVLAKPSPIVLKYCRLRFIKDQELLFVQSTDGKVQVSHSIPILGSDMFDDDFDILIDGKIAVQLIPAIKSDEINLECDTKNAKVTITGGGHEFELLSQLSDDYPKFSIPNNKSNVSLPSGILKKMLTSALAAINKDNSKAVMTCSSLEYCVVENEGALVNKKKQLHIVGASDQVVLFSTFDCDLGDSDFQILVPHYIIPALKNVLEDTDDVVISYAKDEEKNEIKSIFFQTKRAEIGCAPIGDYKYPDWDKHVPGGVKKVKTEKFCKLAVPAELFKESIKYAEVLSDREFKLVKFLYTPGESGSDIGTLNIFSESESGKAKVAPIEVKIINNGDVSFENYFSSEFFNRVIANLTGNDLLLTRVIDDSTKPKALRVDSGNIGSDIAVGSIIAPLNPAKIKKDQPSESKG